MAVEREKEQPQQQRGDIDKSLFGESGTPAFTTHRTRVSDLVFSHLASAVLRGKIAPGDSLPAERDLAERYGVSRVLVREAVHKLKELGLVRVKQGGQTIVLDPHEASDPRIMAIEIELDGTSEETRRDLSEKLVTHAISLLELASGRIAPKELDDLDAICGELAQFDHAEAAVMAHGSPLTQFWITLSRGTGNGLMQRETRFWLDLAVKAEALSCLWTEETHTVYRRLLARLRKNEDAAATFQRVMRTKLDR